MTGSNQTTDLKKLVSPWPTIVVRTCCCTTRPVANFLIVATGLGSATRPGCVGIVWFNFYLHTARVNGLSDELKRESAPVEQ